MKVLYTGTLDVNAGGPAFSTYNTMRGLNAIGVDTHVLMFEMEKNGKLIGNDVPIHFAKKPIPGCWHWVSKRPTKLFPDDIYNE